MRYIIINENQMFVQYHTDQGLILEELQKMVDGYIEHLTINSDRGFAYYINEEGKYTKSVNKFATLWWEYNLGIYNLDDYICGSAVFIGEDENGDMRDLTDDEITEFEYFAKMYYLLEAPGVMSSLQQTGKDSE